MNPDLKRLITGIGILLALSVPATGLFLLMDHFFGDLGKVIFFLTPPALLLAYVVGLIVLEEKK